MVFRRTDGDLFFIFFYLLIYLFIYLFIFNLINNILIVIKTQKSATAILTTNTNNITDGDLLLI